MIAIGNLPPGVSDNDLDAPASDYSRHMEALDRAEESIPCPSCQRKGNVECEQCFGTTLIPATREEWEANEIREVAADIQELCLDRLENIPSAIHLHARLYQIAQELGRRAA